MAIYFESGSANTSRISIWHAEESLDALAALAGLQPDQKPHGTVSRQKERLAVQLLLRRIFPGHTVDALQYDGYGRPLLPGSGYSISISHTGPFVGVLVSPAGRCGLDLEVIHPRIRRIAHRFLTEEELRFAGSEPSLPALYILWGAKEVLYKIHGRKGLVFSEHLSVEPFVPAAEGSVRAHLLADGTDTVFDVRYRLEGQLLITHATPPEDVPA